MGLFSLNSLYRSQPRRARRYSSFGASLDQCESRTLLSGVAIYPQPAASVSTEDVSTAAAPPGDFSGQWDINTTEGSGTAIIMQDGNKLQIALNFGGFDLPASGKVKGDTAKGKIKATVMGLKVKGKVVSTLTGANSMAGTASVKVPGIGKLSIDLQGVRIP
ncbi:MAG: hypothetical protein KDA68_04055 [Planctomycetaceae bacterium]|nr:hypothetical protein [Planctomycetaceae bacterium]